VAKKRTEEKPKEYTRRQLSHAKKEARRQNIILIVGIVVVAVILLIPATGWFVSSYLPLHQTVLEVNGVKFDTAYFIDIMKIRYLNDSTKDSETLAQEALQFMEQGEEMKQGAAKLGMTVSDNETKSYLEMMGLPSTKGFMGYFGNQLLAAELQNVYFGGKVPETAAQVHALMMMLESDQQAMEIKARLANGDNFTALSETYAQNYYSKNVNKGDFGWHVREILKTQTGTDIPLDYAFSAAAGDLSQPLTDNETYKQWGYWLIKIVDRPAEGQVNVQALLVSDNATAIDIKARLEAGTAMLADMADKYTQYSLSKDKKGDLGIIDATDNTTFTQVFNDYTLNPATPAGKWSDPLLEKELWTRGGSWLVKVVEKDENRAVSSEDKTAIVQEAFSNWFSELASDPNLKVDTSFLTDKKYQWAIDKLNKDLVASQGQ
jgi:parvulin-like peptidyl-prolyl isomerase